MKIDWKQISGALLIGLLIGYFAGVYCPYGFRMWGRMHMSPEKKMNWMMKRLSSKLNLTEDQKTQVAQVLESGHKKMMAHHDAERPKFAEVRNETNAAIRKILTSEQQGIFDNLQLEWQARREKHRR